jgi:ElaB/YqjD/DUF883 family membrane-anchored ribosome-binding protein
LDRGIIRIGKGSFTMATKTEKTAEADATPTMEAQLDALRADIAALAATLTAYGKDKVADMQAAADDVAGDAASRARAALRDVRRETDKLEERLQEQVQDKPLQSLLVAFGLGLVVSLILRR